MLLKETRHDELSGTETAVVEALKTVFDPEIPINIYEMGLVYNVEVTAEKHAMVHMTLTSPNCPVAQSLPAEVADMAASVEGVETSEVDVVWDPPWTPDRMSEAAKLTLGMF